jgi:hypothetical protein
MQALADLETLNQNRTEFSPEVQEEYFGLLRGRADVLDGLYMQGKWFRVWFVHVCGLIIFPGPRYKAMVDETIEELRSYSGPDATTSKEVDAFQRLLTKRGWAVTPRLWSRAELTCIAVLTMDPTLVYDGIGQKDGGGEGVWVIGRV